MRRVLWSAAAAAVSFAAGLPAQTVASRVDASNAGVVEFHFAARPGVCGDGRGMVRAASSGGIYLEEDYGGSGPCTAGPVRVELRRDGKVIIGIVVFAGPLLHDSTATDLGVVPSRDAAQYLLGLATTLDGRPAREALLPAMLADSAAVTPALLRIATDHQAARDVRRAAVGDLADRADESGGVGAARVDATLEAMARDRDESEAIRTQALGALAGRDRGAGVARLFPLVTDPDQWLADRAFATVSRSGDPRARQFVRDAIQKGKLGDDQMVNAIGGLGDDYATGADIALLRNLYAGLSSDRQRDAVLSAVAGAGGRENGDWLVSIARSQTEPAARRRRAISLLSRFDEPGIQAALKDLVVR